MRFLDNQSPQARAKQLLLAWGLVLAPFLLWGGLAENIWKRESFRFDNPILLWLHAHSNTFLDRLMVGLSLVGGYPLLVASVLLCVGFWLAHKHREALFVALCMGGASALNVTAKIIFHRTRPDLWVSLAPEHDYSFPSGHAMVSSAFIATILALIWAATSTTATGRMWRSIAAPIGVVFVLAVGLSRLYLGVHYPSDILAGWLASLGWVAMIRIFQILPKFVRQNK